ncbi:MAG: hypothetical protein LBT88_03730 [Oscillospiraceae bacterium]|jgi:hypothetical protein|nr:hypothetical protein [Oscillospiraceae bacterium]
MDKKLKRENIWFGIVTALIAAAVICYLYFYSYAVLSNQILTVPVIKSETYDSIPAEGIIIRDEKLVRGIAQERYAYVTALDGTRVAVGEEIAVSFDTIDAWTMTQRAYDLDAKIKSLESVMGDSGISEARLDSALHNGVNEIRNAVRQQDYRAAGEKSAGIIALARNGLDAKNALTALKAERAGIGTYTAQRIVSDAPGVFSRYSDGYVGDPQIAAANIELLDASRLKVLLNMQPAAPADAIGKLVLDEIWYYAAIIDGEAASALAGQTGRKFIFDLSGSGSGQVNVTLVSVSYAGVGDSYAVFSCNTAMTEIIKLRKVNANIILNHYEGLRIPRAALKLESVSDEDAALKPCVYVLQGPYAERRFVQILDERDEYYIVAEDIYSVSALKAGDNLITSGKDLYDGKVVN